MNQKDEQAQGSGLSAMVRPCPWCGDSMELETARCIKCQKGDLDDRDELIEALKPWGSGGVITGTALAWIAAKDKELAKQIVNLKAKADRALTRHHSTT